MVSYLGDIDGVAVGHETDAVGLTGCTAVVFERGAVGGHALCGSGSGSRELAAFTPQHSTPRVHGVSLCGGSAFGLAACSGVVRRLEAAGIGHPTPFGLVPIVGGAVIYDLCVGDPRARPTEQQGEAAAGQALAGAGRQSGNVGAGTGATAGKLLGIECATKTGLGNAGMVTDDGVAIAALAVVNPVGDVLDPTDRTILAGARRDPRSMEPANITELLRAGHQFPRLARRNTTLCVLATDAQVDALGCSWLAQQVAVTIGRLIDPPFTRHDGDLVFFTSVGDRPCEPHRLAILARDVLAAAVVDACRAAAPAGGLPSAAQLVGAGDRSRSP